MIIKEPLNDSANAKAKKDYFKIRTYTGGFIFFYFFGKTTDGQVFRKVGCCNRQ
jgi:hypothetical protein